ncbi:MAG: hypothetical protein WC584_01180 [Candidatus Pacearchaeota archaeon]
MSFFNLKKKSPENESRVKLEKSLDKVCFENGNDNFGDKKFYALVRGACMNSILHGNPNLLTIAEIYFNRYQKMFRLESQKREVIDEIKEKYAALIDLARKGKDFRKLEESAIDYIERVQIKTEIPIAVEPEEIIYKEGNGRKPK